MKLSTIKLHPRDVDDVKDYSFSYKYKHKDIKIKNKKIAYSNKYRKYIETG